MTSFEKAYNKTLRWEGVYIFDKDDRGGETLYGIARKTHPDWSGWSVVDILKLNNDAAFKIILSDPANKTSVDFLKTQAMKLYRENYWSKVRAEELVSQHVANALYDFAVNSGVRTATTKLASVLHIKSAGGVTAEMIDKANVLADTYVCNNLCKARLIYLQSINPTYAKKYMKGWTNRVNDFMMI